MEMSSAKTAIQNICTQIQNLLQSVRPPANVIPGIIMICSLSKRPGLSTIVSVGNIINTLSSKGFRSEKNIDGTANRTNLLVESIVSEIYRALKNDMNIQVAMKPGSIAFTGIGQSSSGPVTVEGTNTTFGTGYGIGQ